MSGIDALYQEAIKDYARADHGHGRLDAASAAVRLDNPLCGDRISLQVSLAAGRIVAIAHETKGCLLCRAAASLLGKRGPGLDATGVTATTAALEAILEQRSPPPTDWPELGMFAPAGGHPSRHKCVLLPFRALAQAIQQADAVSPANQGADHREH
ncbi:iron-sulfur cluster assembly scaffold protein [Sulfuritalea sp.]|uniref:iron-sulfur cluster assembly scaffold protein n=1 Tax=Sulfuritalea sp. TaxID=2480090 RepID=UPI001ACD7C45|nr:iron-sulfur cluster assembly scaffold protein [Sulfuritalea sp.]MBN8476079.1 iron-sulfur cluster assembly scaffold protein [Sulfuritalea sp.]